MCEEEFAKRQKQRKVYHMGLVTRQGAEKSLSGVSAEKFRASYPVPPDKAERTFKASVTVNHNSIYMAGESIHSKRISSKLRLR